MVFTTLKRAAELLAIERECVARECDRNCAVCELVQEQDELIGMYDRVISFLENLIHMEGIEE